MKYILLLCSFSLCISSGYAQKNKASDDALDKKVLAVNIEGASLATLEMERELSLDLGQQQEVQLLNDSLYRQLMLTREKFSHDSQLQAAALRSIHIESDKALKRILTENQLKKYLELEGREHADHLSELDN